MPLETMTLKSDGLNSVAATPREHDARHQSLQVANFSVAEAGVGADEFDDEAAVGCSGGQVLNVLDLAILHCDAQRLVHNVERGTLNVAVRRTLSRPGGSLNLEALHHLRELHLKLMERESFPQRLFLLFSPAE